MNIMTKRGSEDNIVTYEHYCDTKADLANIPQDQIALGSVAIVLKDEDDSMGIYLANSNKEWISFSTTGGGSSMSDISLANLIDVSLANPNDGDTLIYDATSEKWVAQAGSGGSNIMVVNFSGYNFINPSDPISADKTFNEISTHINNGGFAIGRDEDMNTYVLSKYEPNDGTDSGYIVFSMPFYFDGSNMGAQTNYYACQQYVVYTNKVVYNNYQRNN